MMTTERALRSEIALLRAEAQRLRIENAELARRAAGAAEALLVIPKEKDPSRHVERSD